jgi:hypothetical protein
MEQRHITCKVARTMAYNALHRMRGESDILWVIEGLYMLRIFMLAV